MSELPTSTLESQDFDPSMTTAAPTPKMMSRGPAILGVVGGALAIIGFFLPWLGTTINASGDPSNSGSVPHTITISGWDIVNQLLTGTSLTGIPSDHTSTAIPYALLAAIPLLMATVAMICAASGFWRKPNAVLIGIYTAAAIMGLLNIISGYSGLYISALALAAVTGGAAYVGIGLDMLYLGYFAIVAGGVALLAQGNTPQK